MVLIEVTVVEGAFTDMEVRQLTTALTEAVLGVGGQGLRDGTEVIIREVAKHRWSSGGYPFAAEDVRALKRNDDGGESGC